MEKTILVVWAWLLATFATENGVTAVLAFIAYVLKMLLTRRAVGDGPLLPVLRSVGSDFAYMAFTFSMTRFVKGYDPSTGVVSGIPVWYLPVLLVSLTWWYCTWTITLPGEKEAPGVARVLLSAVMGLFSYFFTVLVVF